MLANHEDENLQLATALASHSGLKSDGVIGFKNKAGRVYASEVLKCMARTSGFGWVL